MSMEAQTRLPWTAEEDNILIELVQKYGEKRWNMVANGLPGRTGKGCSHRWRTYLRPDVKHPHLEPFTEWEAAVIVQAQRDMGNNWLAIAKLLLPGRSNTAVKNFWHCRLKGGSGTHTNRFIVENYNLRYLLNEVQEKDKLHPVALPAFPSTAPTGQLRRQIHPRPRQEAAAQAAAYAEAQMAAAQMTAQAQAMGMDVQTYMQQQGMVDASGAYLGMCAFDPSQGYSHPSSGSFSSRDELKQHASAYVQQQLSLMGHPGPSHATNGRGTSSKHGYDPHTMAYCGSGFGQEAATSSGGAGAAAGGASKKTGRCRGRPPGPKAQAQKSNTGMSADASAQHAEQYALYQQQQQYSMRASQDDAATWCSTGTVVVPESPGAAAAAAAAQLSAEAAAGEFHSASTVPSHAITAGALATAALGTAALSGSQMTQAAVTEQYTGGFADVTLPVAAVLGPAAAAGPAAADAAAPVPQEMSALLPVSAAAAADVHQMPQFRVSMTGLEFELEAATGAQTVRLSARSFKMFECEDGVGPAACKASMCGIDFRSSLTSLEDILGDESVNRMSNRTHLALRGPSWDGGAQDPASPSTTHAAGDAGPLAAAEAAAAAFTNGSSAAEGLAALNQQQAMLPAISSGGMSPACAWATAQQLPLSSAAMGTTLGAFCAPTSVNELQAVSFTFPVVPSALEDIHPGALTAPGDAVATCYSTAAAATCNSSPLFAPAGNGTPFSSAGLQAAPFSPVPAAAAAAAAALPCSTALPGLLHPRAPFTEGVMGSSGCGPAEAGMMDLTKQAAKDPPTAPCMPPAFHSVLQALQPPTGLPARYDYVLGGHSQPPGGLEMMQPKVEQQQQPPGTEPALAAASPAILSHPLTVAVVSSGLQQQQQHLSTAGIAQHQQLMLQLPLPTQLLWSTAQEGQSGVPRTVPDLPLPSPIELFQGDHGLHNEDLLIDAAEVFDEGMLQPGSTQQTLKKGHAVNRAGPHSEPAARTSAADVANAVDTCPAAPETTVPVQLHGSAGAAKAHMSVGLTPKQAAHQQVLPLTGTADVLGVKRRRSSAGGSGCTKKQRPSEGSLVEVYHAHHGLNDCLHFWHD